MQWVFSSSAETVRIWRVFDAPSPEVLRTVFHTVLARHDILRAPCRNPAEAIALPCLDLPTQDEAKIVRLLRTELEQSFGAVSDLPMRALLLRLPANEVRFVLVAKVLAFDDSSLDLIGAEIAAALAGRALSPVRRFAERNTEPPGDADLAWWRKTLADPPRTDLAPDYAVAGKVAFTATESLPLAPELVAQLANFTAATSDAAAGDAAPDPLLAPAAVGLAVLLQRHTGEDEVLLGCEMSTRRPGVDAGVVGPFTSPVAVRLDLSGDLPGETALARVREAVEAAWTHRFVQVHRVAKMLEENGAAALDTLLSIRLAVRRVPPPGDRIIELPGAPLARHDRFRFELRLDSDGRARLNCAYHAGLYRSETVERLLAGWARALEGLVRSPRARLAGIDVLTEAERHRMLLAFNDTARNYPDTLAIRLVEAQARVVPGRIALVCGERTMTYGELDNNVDRLAATLVQRGVGRGVRVGLLLQRGPEMFVAVLATLKAGAAYVPLDPAVPSERLRYMLEDSGASLVVTQSALLGRLEGEGPTRLILDSDSWLDATAVPTTTAAIAPEDSAYIIYTSGSTGQPKGVEVPHRALTNFLLSMREAPGLASSDTMLLVNTLAFDMSVLEFYLPLLVGARVVIAAADEAGDGAALVRLISRHAVSVIQAGPTRLRLMLEAGWTPGAALRIITGSEPVSRSLADQLAPFGEVWNMYGPTETTVWSTCQRIAPGVGPVPIGRPIANTQVYVLDRAGNLAPLGAAGELGIAGRGVATGYLHQRELTAARFPPNPFGPGRMYLTGDRVRWRHDGELEFLSRLDHQVKLRGFRIEPGEVEAALLRHPDLRQALVLAGTLWTGEKGLIAYVVPNDPQAWPAIERDLPNLLAMWLPRYMLPQATIMLPELPLSPNGKIDRRRLPLPRCPSDADEHGLDRQGREQSVPDDPDKFPAQPDHALIESMEERLVAIWRDVLKLPSVGPHDDFFDLGGDSLLALTLMAEILRKTGQDLPITAIYDAWTPAAMARLLTTGKPSTRASCLVPLKRGNGPPLFIAAGIGGSVMELRDLARQLDVGGPVYGVESRGLDGAAPPLERIEDMAAFHLTEMRRFQPDGPLRLAGFSFGGLVALEMAQQLARAGETVQSLFLLDCFPHPKYWPLRCRAVAWWALVRSGRSSFTWRRIRGHYASGFRNLPHGERLARAAAHLRKVAMLPFNMTYLLWFLQRFVAEEEVPLMDDPTVTPAIERVRKANVEAFIAYRPVAYAGEIILVEGLKQSHPPFEARLLWRALARNIKVLNVSGPHARLSQSDGHPLLAEALSAALRHSGA